MTTTERLAKIAYKMGLTPIQASALPTVIEVSARKVEMSQRTFIEEVDNNVNLQAYLADICHTTVAA